MSEYPFKFPKVNDKKYFNNNFGRDDYDNVMEDILKIDSLDRNIDIYPDPFTFKVRFNQQPNKYDKYGRNGPIINRPLKNIKSIRLTQAIFPRYLLKCDFRNQELYNDILVSIDPHFELNEKLVSQVGICFGEGDNIKIEINNRSYNAKIMEIIKIGNKFRYYIEIEKVKINDNNVNIIVNNINSILIFKMVIRSKKEENITNLDFIKINDIYIKVDDIILNSEPYQKIIEIDNNNILNYNGERILDNNIVGFKKNINEDYDQYERLEETNIEENIITSNIYNFKEIVIGTLIKVIDSNGNNRFYGVKRILNRYQIELNILWEDNNFEMDNIEDYFIYPCEVMKGEDLSDERYILFDLDEFNMGPNLGTNNILSRAFGILYPAGDNDNFSFWVGMTGKDYPLRDIKDLNYMTIRFFRSDGKPLRMLNLTDDTNMEAINQINHIKNQVHLTFKITVLDHIIEK